MGYWEKLHELKQALQGKKPFLITMLEGGESYFNALKLDKELALLEQDPPKQLPLSPQELQTTLFNQKQADWKLLYKKAASMHAKLLLVDKEERKQLAFEIVNLSNQLETLWAGIDYYKKNGHWPQAAFVSDLDSNQKRINNLRTYISKFKKDPAKAAKVAEWKAELSILEGMQ